MQEWAFQGSQAGGVLVASSLRFLPNPYQLPSPHRTPYASLNSFRLRASFVVVIVLSRLAALGVTAWSRVLHGEHRVLA